MRKIVLTLAALAAFGIALPVATTSANAETVVIKKSHRDHGRHHGWDRGRHEGWRNHRRDRVVVREGRRHHGATVGVSVR
jgi:Ni/Co efflux regulator RcnB